MVENEPLSFALNRKSYLTTNCQHPFSFS